jgi:two-component system, chemotaxis family, chemotaxis protein CheY
VEDRNGNRAMIVDDSRAMRMILRKMLGELGYDASEAANGQEALQRLEQEAVPPSFMFVDWNMPVMCGIDMVKAVRADARYAAVTLIMVTTETDIQHISEALEAGANEYVMKPFTKEAIEDKLRVLNLVQ